MLVDPLTASLNELNLKEHAVKVEDEHAQDAAAQGRSATPVLSNSTEPTQQDDAPKAVPVSIPMAKPSLTVGAVQYHQPSSLSPSSTVPPLVEDGTDGSVVSSNLGSHRSSQDFLPLPPSKTSVNHQPQQAFSYDVPVMAHPPYYDPFQATHYVHPLAHSQEVDYRAPPQQVNYRAPSQYASAFGSTPPGLPQPMTTSFTTPATYQQAPYDAHNFYDQAQPQFWPPLNLPRNAFGGYILPPHTDTPSPPPGVSLQLWAQLYGALPTSFVPTVIPSSWTPDHPMGVLTASTRDSFGPVAPWIMYFLNLGLNVHRFAKCKYFDVVKGYGFLIDDNLRELGGRDVFVHFTGIKMRSGFRCLSGEEWVEYDLGRAATGGFQAFNVTGAYGTALKGLTAEQYAEHTRGEQGRGSRTTTGARTRPRLTTGIVPRYRGGADVGPRCSDYAAFFAARLGSTSHAQQQQQPLPPQQAQQPQHQRQQQQQQQHEEQQLSSSNEESIEA